VQSDRFEIPILRGEKNFEVTSVDDHGLFLMRRVEATASDPIEIIKLDTSFTVNWRGYIEVDKKYALMGKRAFQDKLYILLRYHDLSKKDMMLYAVNQDKGSYFQYIIKNFIPFVPIDFQITEKAVIIGGYFNQIPVLIYFDPITQKTKVLPGLLNESGELTQIKTYPDNSFDVLISAKNFKGQQTIWIKNYDAEGNLMRNLALEPEGKKHLIFARSLKTINNMEVVAGVYGARNSEYSKGIFIASIDPNGLQQLRYYNYADLENFFRYMKAKRERRVKERIQRRKIKGKKIRFNYRFMVHEIVPYQNQFVLLGEAFYPKYTSVDRSFYGGFFSPYVFNRNTYVRDGRVFDGYRYTHAVVMGFNRDGNLKWDNSFEINDVKTFTLEQYVKLEPFPDKIVLLYLFENQLRSKIIKDNQVLEGKTYEPIKTPVEGEITLSESSGSGKLDYWYKDYFYAFGVQDVSNATRGKRHVFFVNKVRYAN
jgi:hypothetical protein